MPNIVNFNRTPSQLRAAMLKVSSDPVYKDKIMSLTEDEILAVNNSVKLSVSDINKEIEQAGRALSGFVAKYSADNDGGDAMLLAVINFVALLVDDVQQERPDAVTLGQVYDILLNTIKKFRILAVVTGGDS